MERLTDRFRDGRPFVKPSIANSTTGYCQVIQKLADYEDLAEHGRLVELPIAIGKTIYIVEFNSDANNGYYYETGMSLRLYDEKKDYFKYGRVFTSPSEAEKLLNKLKIVKPEKCKNCIYNYSCDTNYCKMENNICSNGNFLKLFCKAGDTLWYLNSSKKEIHKFQIMKIEIYENEIFYTDECDNKWHIDEFDSNFYKTEEEAVDALKKLK